MSSTDEKTLRRFFRGPLLQAAESLRERGVRFFALGPESDLESWYEPSPEGEPECIEMELEDFETALRERWEGEDLAELAGLAAALMRLARELELDEDQSAEISPFVYVMY